MGRQKPALEVKTGDILFILVVCRADNPSLPNVTLTCWGGIVLKEAQDVSGSFTRVSYIEGYNFAIPEDWERSERVVTIR